MKYEVFIPASGSASFDVTLRLEAENWMAALRAGLGKMGEQGTAIQNIICDIQEDNSIHVTDPNSHRVFRIRELGDAAAAPAPAAAAAAAPAPAVEPEPPRSRAQVMPVARGEAPPPKKVEPAKPAAKAPEAPKAAAPPEAAKPAKAKEPEKAAKGKTAKAPSRPAEPQEGEAEKTVPNFQVTPPPPAPRAKPPAEPVNILSEVQSAPSPKPQPIGRQEEPTNVDDILSRAFDDMLDLELQPDNNAAAGLALQIGLKYIDADAGSVLLSDINGRDLYFAAARGPKASKLQDVTIRMGQGIVGFCAQQGVSLAVSDVQKDPRFYAQVSKQIGYDTKSILCVPIERDGRSFGAMEIINKRKSAQFTASELNILHYVASRLGEYLEARA